MCFILSIVYMFDLMGASPRHHFGTNFGPFFAGRGSQYSSVAQRNKVLLPGAGEIGCPVALSEIKEITLCPRVSFLVLVENGWPSKRTPVPLSCCCFRGNCPFGESPKGTSKCRHGNQPMVSQKACSCMLQSRPAYS